LAVDIVLVLAVAAVALTLAFDFTNGFNDAANIMAMPIASRAISPLNAALLVGFFEFLGPLLGGTAVASTIGKIGSMEGLPEPLSLIVLLCAIAAAISWNLLAWKYGIPSSSSHALVGGLVGAIGVGVGWDHVRWGFTTFAESGTLDGVAKVLLALVAAPIVSGLVGFAIHGIMRRVCSGATVALNRHLKVLQYFTTSVMAFAHGANDAQKSMGVITAVLLLGGFIPVFEPPLWVVVACGGTIAVGAMLGGWRIIRTVGFQIYRIRHLHAVDTQLAAGTVILTAAMLGGPVSTAHVTTSSIIGVGASERPKSIRWSRGQQIVKTWIVTIPGSGAIAGSLAFVSLAIASAAGLV
jgi:PiT family inorganic phosphate transporter